MPEGADLALELPVAAEAPKDSRQAEEIALARRLIPTKQAGWSARIESVEGERIVLSIAHPSDASLKGKDLYFFPAQESVIDPGAKQRVRLGADAARLELAKSPYARGQIESIDGVLVITPSSDKQATRAIALTAQ